jgi:hypothetical protein
MATVSFLDPLRGHFSTLVHHQKSRGLREPQTDNISQCVLRILDGFFFLLVGIAFLILWKARMLCLLWSLPCGVEAMLMTDSLSPNIMAAPFAGIPKYLSEVEWSMICSIQVFVAIYSEPKVAVSTVPNSFLNERNRKNSASQLSAT